MCSREFQNSCHDVWTISGNIGRIKIEWTWWERFKIETVAIYSVEVGKYNHQIDYLLD